LSPVPLFSTYPTELVNWKDCRVSEDEEKQMAAAFGKKFQLYDFNLSYYGDETQAVNINNSTSVQAC